MIMGQLPNEDIPLNRSGEQYRKLHPEEARQRDEEVGKVRRSHGDLLIEMEIEMKKEKYDEHIVLNHDRPADDREKDPQAPTPEPAS